MSDLGPDRLREINDGWRGDEDLEALAELWQRDRALLREVALSEVALTDPHMRYVTVQIDRETWERVREIGCKA